MLLTPWRIAVNTCEVTRMLPSGDDVAITVPCEQMR
jgi:hypothetical protein